MTKQPTTLGAFSVSLAVKNLQASQAFYEKLVFAQVFSFRNSQFQISQHLTRMHAPFLDDFFLATPEDLREMRHGAMLQTRHEDVTLSWQL